MAIKILSSENITGNITLHSPTNAPYIDFVENADTGDSKARITMDQIDTNNGQLIFSTEKAGTLTNALVINNSGNVGIGADVPNAKLHIAGGSSGVFLSNLGNNSAYDSIKMSYNGYNSGIPEFIFTQTTTPGSGIANTFYRFENTNGVDGTNPNNVANVTIGGKLGIGTDSPDTTLNLDASDGANIRLERSSVSTNRFDIGTDGTDMQFVVRDSGNFTFTGGHVGIKTIPQTTLADFSTIEIGNIGMIMSEKADSQYNSMFVSSNAYYAAGWKRKTATVAGSAYMSMYLGGIRFGTAPQDTADSAITWTNRLVIANGGNVGIGTDDPKHLLHIKSTISGPTGIIIENTNNAQSLDIDFWNNAGAAQARIRYNEGAGSFDFSPNVGVGPAVTMLYGGNVGVGVTNPTDGKLQVYGNSSSDWGTYIWNQHANGIGLHVETNSYGTEQLLRLSSLTGSGGSNTVRMVVRADGNVGIGNTTPGGKLTVGGTVQVEDGGARRYALQPSYWGYSASYRTLILGSASTTYTDQDTGSVTLCFGVDVSGNPSGSFSGNGSELIFRNGATFITPNTANNGYNSNTLVLKDGNVGIGTAVPTNGKLDVRGRLLVNGTGTNDGFGSEQTLTIKKVLGNNGVATKVAVVGHTHALQITAVVYQTGTSGCTATGISTKYYGFGTTGFNQVSSSGSGVITNISLAYLNTNPDGTNYVLTVTPTFTSGTPPTCYLTIRGQSDQYMVAYTT